MDSRSRSLMRTEDVPLKLCFVFPSKKKNAYSDMFVGACGIRVPSCIYAFMKYKRIQNLSTSTIAFSYMFVRARGIRVPLVLRCTICRWICETLSISISWKLAPWTPLWRCCTVMTKMTGACAHVYIFFCALRFCFTLSSAASCLLCLLFPILSVSFPYFVYFFFSFRYFRLWAIVSLHILP